MKSSQRQEGKGRTELEVNMILEAPLTFELQAAGQAMVDLIKKAPPELQPAALATALVTINEFRLIADAFVRQLPDYPASLSAKRIETEGQELEDFYKNIPAGSPAELFLPALNLLSNVNGMVSPVTNDAPTLPHQLTVSLINNQVEMLLEYITRKSLA